MHVCDDALDHGDVACAATLCFHTYVLRHVTTTAQLMCHAERPPQCCCEGHVWPGCSDTASPLSGLRAETMQKNAMTQPICIHAQLKRYAADWITASAMRQVLDFPGNCESRQRYRHAWYCQSPWQFCVRIVDKLSMVLARDGLPVQLGKRPF